MLLWGVWLVFQAAAGSSFVSLSPQDEREIRAAILSDAVGNAHPQIASDLDWENAFGVRYNDLQRRDAFYRNIIERLTRKAEDDSREIKIKLVSPDVAVADEYWRLTGELDQSTGEAGPERWGRTTYVLKRTDGQWTVVIERIADLRKPYYTHFKKYPEAYPVPKKKLDSYAGKFEVAPGVRYDVQVSGDHLEVTTGPGPGRFLAIPRSESDFVLFLDPNDLENYKYLSYGRDKDGAVQLTVSDQAGPGTVAKKVITPP